jgi:hypothetical protein
MLITTRFINRQNFRKFIHCKNFKSYTALKDLHFTHGVNSTTSVIRQVRAVEVQCFLCGRNYISKCYFSFRFKRFNLLFETSSPSK